MRSYMCPAPSGSVSRWRGGFLRDWGWYRPVWESFLQQRAHNAVGCPFTCPYYKGKVGYAAMETPVTDDLLARCVTIAFNPMMTPETGDRIAEAIQKVADNVL